MIIILYRSRNAVQHETISRLLYIARSSVREASRVVVAVAIAVKIISQSFRTMLKKGNV